MSPALRSGLAAMLALGALLSDWVCAELYLRNDSASHVAGALALNAPRSRRRICCCVAC